MENFLPKFPNVHKLADMVLNTYDSTPFNDAIVSKKEFADLQLEFIEPSPKEKGGQYNHQKMIARFFSTVTPYNRLLLFHSMGTGKTCTAIAAIEQIRYEKDSYIKGATIFAKGTRLLKNFTQELLFTCTDGRYIPDNYDKLTDMERVIRTRKSVETFYEFHTFEKFAKDISGYSDEKLKEWNNHILVLDEIQNIREKDEKTKKDDTDELFMYKQFHRFLHVVENCKVLLLSGTPMKNGPEEFGSVMNLLLPLDDQFEERFVANYFLDGKRFDPSKEAEFARKISGKVSYLKSVITDVRKDFIGEKLGLDHFIVKSSEMSDFQNEAYLRALASDKGDRAFYSNSRQAALFVFPDGTWGSDGFNRYFSKRRYGNKTQFIPSREFTDALAANPISKFSCKYAQLIDTLTSKSFAYCEYVNGSGAIVLSKCLEAAGFSAATGTETTKRKRYVLINNQSSSNAQIQTVINRFNADDNVDGEYIQLVIGSKVIAEGFTFKSIRQEYILTPDWNYAIIEQAIARGWRLNSHKQLINRGDTDITVKIYQQVAFPQNRDRRSIDYHMYQTSEQKDVIIKQIEHIIKTNAFDCPLNEKRNKIGNAFDGMRECEYTKCDYTCKGQIREPLDKSTYQIYHSSKIDIYETLKLYFRTRFYIPYEQLFGLFEKDYNVFEVLKSVNEMINEGSQFVNRYGFPSYLCAQNDLLCITSDPRIAGNDIFSDYYSKHLVIENGDSFSEIIRDMYNEGIPAAIDRMFKSPPSTVKDQVIEFPEEVQRTILEGAILSKKKGLSVRTAARDQILDLFTGFYGEIDDRESIWLYKDTLGSVVLNDNDVWVPAKLNKLDQIIKVKQKLLKTSPIGFYGMYNPKLDDFCIRDVKDLNETEVDLRKITVGRRCVDWNKRTLAQMLANLIKREPPKLFLRGETLADLLPVVRGKKGSTEEDVSSLEAARRFLYWSNQKRADLCKELKKWFEENNLLEENYDCGHQRKTRVRFK